MPMIVKSKLSPFNFGSPTAKSSLLYVDRYIITGKVGYIELTDAQVKKNLLCAKIEYVVGEQK